jgi:hypothetical protein
MTHFTSKEDLKAFLNADQVTALFSKIPAEQQESHFDYTDSLITSKTGEEPDETDNYPILTSIASRIVIWFLSGTQQWNDTNKPELDRREKLYKDALSELDEVADGEIVLDPDAEDKSGSECGHDERRTEPW